METKAVHAGRGVDPATGAVTPPIHLSTTFERDADGGYPRGYEYARESNPNRDALEECVRELEGGAAAASFSSGMAATRRSCRRSPPATTWSSRTTPTLGRGRSSRTFSPGGAWRPPSST